MGVEMMRETKFRAWDKDNKIVGYEKWYEGAWKEEEPEAYPNISRYVAPPCWLYSTDGKNWTPNFIPHRYKDQFIGLKDKNGKECYEDDWVTDGINPPFCVVWDYHLLARLSEIDFEIVGHQMEGEFICPESRRPWYSEVAMCNLDDHICLLEAGKECEYYQEFLQEVEDDKSPSTGTG